MLTLTNLAQTAPYMVFAVLLIAGLKATGSEALIANAFKGREKRMIVFAALLGGLAPFCSCEVIPFIAGLLALGTPLSAIMAFWLSSPLIDPPTLLITAAALGWKFAIAKAFIAVALGLMGGFAIKLCSSAGYFKNPYQARKKKSSSSCSDSADSCSTSGSCGSSSLSDKKPVWRFWTETKRRDIFRSELFENALFLLKWMLFAYTLESLMIHYIPAESIASVVGGNGILPVMISALVGVPAYLNSYIAPALVAGLISQGMSVGSGMAFVVAGAVSSIPAMTAVFPLVRRPVFAAYVLLGFAGAVLAGLIYGML
ncbi:MAG: permease [SAR324 cluster bacterium]|nr:permease [SAR324 cluster bacterium]